MKNSSKPGFDANFFAGNRQALLKSLGGGALVVLTAYSAMQRRADAAFKFEQEANFWYLTGIDAPDWQVIIDGSQRKAWLVQPEVDDVRNLFDGSLSAENAMKQSGIKDVLDRTEARQLLAKLKSSHSVAYTVLPSAEHERHGFTPNPAGKRLSEELKSHYAVQDAGEKLAKLRAIKQPVEIAAIQKAVDITVGGIKSALRQLKNMKYEYEFEAVLNAHFRAAGAEGHAYDPIIAGGDNACTLHYIANNDRLQKKDWLLFDAGAYWQHYAADITRTVPLGQPTQWQRDVYEATLRVHDAAIKLCAPGRSVIAYQQAVDEAMEDELVALGLIERGDKDGLRHYFPHAISHGLGIDVHDPLGKPVQFDVGMVLTVEPGIYVPEKGFGVRIEDDILITEDGPKNLSAKLPVSLEGLKKLMV
jgi:Xaa-Pro aminopeptidase